jgi:hypothetical protein
MWQSVATCAPTRQVLSSLDDVFDEMSSPLLLVTDVVPMVVEFSDQKQVPAVTLAIARLGGYIELVPLPPDIFWYGPEIDANPRKQKRQNKNLPPEHYAARMPNLSQSENGTLTITTAQFHTDVLGLAAFRTRVETKNNEEERDAEWNQELYPQNPPAEFVLTAYGMKDGTERISFWCVCTIVGPPQNRDPKDDHIGFSLRLAVIEALDIGSLGPEMTIFASPDIMRCWRKAKGVELMDEDGGGTDKGEHDDDDDDGGGGTQKNRRRLQ